MLVFRLRNMLGVSFVGPEFEVGCYRKSVI